MNKTTHTKGATYFTSSDSSLCMRVVGDEVVVSAFELGADGLPDYDRELFVESFTSVAAAAELFFKARQVLCD